MKYVIEVTSSTAAGPECLSRTIVDGKDLGVIRRKAIALLSIWAKQGATGAHVLTEDGQVSMDVGVSN